MAIFTNSALFLYGRAKLALGVFTVNVIRFYGKFEAFSCFNFLFCLWVKLPYYLSFPSVSKCYYLSSKLIGIGFMSTCCRRIYSTIPIGLYILRTLYFGFVFELCYMEVFDSIFGKLFISSLNLKLSFWARIDVS